MRLFRLASVVLLLSTLVIAADSPFAGTWKYDAAKSESIPPPMKSSTARVEADDTNFKITQEFVDNKGQSSTVSFEAKFDGKKYPVSGNPDYVDQPQADWRSNVGSHLHQGEQGCREKYVRCCERRKEWHSSYFRPVRGKAEDGQRCLRKGVTPCFAVSLARQWQKSPDDLGQQRVHHLISLRTKSSPTSAPRMMTRAKSSDFLNSTRTRTRCM